MSSNPVSDGGSLNWASPATDSSNQTTRKATFEAGGKTYTVTVSFNREAVKSNYGVDDGKVDETMEQVINRMGTETLKQLSGYSVSTSLSDIDNQTVFQKIGDPTSAKFSQSLQSSNPQLFGTMQKVIAAFKNNLPALQGTSSTPPLTLTVEEDEGEKSKSTDQQPRIRFREVEGEAEIDENSLKAIKDKLLGKNPAKDNDDLLRVVIKYNQDKADAQKDVIKKEIQDLDTEFQNDVIKLIADESLADGLRIELGLLKEGDIVVDYSQGSIEGFDEATAGQEACARICGVVVERLARDEPIKSKEDIQEVILVGIDKLKGGEAVNFGDDVAPTLNVGEGMKLHVDEGITEALGMFTAPLAAVATFQKQDRSGIAETLLVYPTGGQYALFNSHGSSYQGVSRGASLLKFNNHADLMGHLKDKYPMETHNWSVQHLSIVKPEEEVKQEGSID
jgi:hypothetical protein